MAAILSPGSIGSGASTHALFPQAPRPSTVRALITTALALFMAASVLTVAQPAQFAAQPVDASSDEAAASLESTATSQTVAAGEVPDGLSATEWESIQSQIAASQTAETERVLALEAVPATVTPPAPLAAEIATSSVHVRSGPLDASFHPWGSVVVSSQGDGPVALATPGLGTVDTITSADGLTTYGRDGGVTEWYREVPSGFQQGWTLTEPIAADGSPTIIDVAVTGGTPTLAGADLVHIERVGFADLIYRDLVAWDADGVDLAADMTIADGVIRLTIDTAAAAYPVTIDPIITEDSTVAGLTNTSGEAAGTAVAVGVDTVVVASPFDDDTGLDLGKVEVFDFDGTLTFDSAWYGGGNAASDFGWTVATTGNTFIVGAPGDGTNGADAGAVYVYQRGFPGDPWGLTNTLYACVTVPCDPSVAGGGTAGERFGTSVALTDDEQFIAIGAPGFGTAGSVYVIDSTAPALAQVISTPDPGSDDAFGAAIDIAGDGSLLIVGAPTADFFGQNDSGVAYLFDGGIGSFALASTLDPAFGGTSAEANYGAAVAIEVAGTAPDVPYAVVAEPFLTRLPGDVGGGPGGVEVYDISDPTSPGNPIAQFGVADLDDGFGYSVDAEGDVIVIGEPFAAPNGGIEVVLRNGNSFTTTPLTPPPLFDVGVVDARSGSSVSIGSTGTIAIGEPGDDTADSVDGGQVRVIQDINTVPLTYLEQGSLGDSIGDEFGHAVAIDGNRMAVAAIADDEPNPRSGVVQIFERPDPASVWTIVDIIRDPSPRDNGQFGYSIDLQGDDLVVGEPGTGADIGEVHTFRRDAGGAWLERGVTKSVAGAGGDRFGAAVTFVENEGLLIGAPQQNGAGSIYTGQWLAGDDWGFTEILAGQASAGDQFGFSVDAAWQGTFYLVAVGAPGDDSAGIDAGAVYILGGTEAGGLAIIDSEDGGGAWPAGARVGAAVATEHNRIAVAGLGTQAAGADYGVHLLTEIAALDYGLNSSATGALANPVIGAPNAFVDIYGGTVAVGRPGAGGQVDLFRFDGTALSSTPDDTIIPTGTNEGDRVGFAVDIDGADVAVGAPGDDAVAGIDNGLVTVTTVPVIASWTGAGADQNWTNPQNWDALAVPGATDVAIINTGAAAGTPAIVDENVAIGELIVGSGSNLQIGDADGLTEQLLIAGGVPGAVPTTSNGGNIDVQGELLLDTNMANTGTVSIQSTGFMTLQTATDVTVAPGGTWNIDGEIRKTGTGTFIIDNSATWSPSSSAVFDIDAGRFSVESIASDDGTYNIGAGATLEHSDNGDQPVSGTYNLVITGPSNDTANYGRVLWGGDTTISGSVNTDTVGYTPVAGDDYLLVVCSFGTGCDQTLAGTNSPGLDVTQTPGEIRAAFAAAPAPENPSIAIDGEWAAVGVPGQADVFIMQRVNGVWTDVQTISDVGTPGFGERVTLAMPYLAVAAPNGDTVEVYERVAGAFTPLATLVGDADSDFGDAIDADDEHLVIGAPLDDTAFTDAGAVVIYDLVADAEVTELFGSSSVERFGSDVAVTVNDVWVGAPGVSVPPNGAGSILRYDLTGTLLETIADEIPEAGAGFTPTLDAIPGQVVADRQVTDDAVSYDIVSGYETIPGTSSAYAEQISVNGNMLAINDTNLPALSLLSSNGDGTSYSVEGTDTAAVYTDVSADGGVFAAVTAPVGVVTSGNDIAIFIADPTPTDSTKLLPDVGSAGDQLGGVVAIDGDVLVATAPFFDGEARNQGAAYVFTRTAGVWAQSQLITDTGTLSPAVAIDGTTLAIATPSGVNVYVDAGAGYVLTGATALPFTPRVLRIDNGTLVAGLPNDSGGVGSVYVFNGGATGWDLDPPQVITPATPLTATDNFGHSVDVDANRIVIGAPLAASFNGAVTAPSYIEIWDRPDSASAFGLTATIPNGEIGDRYGWAVAVEDAVIAVAAPLSPDPVVFLLSEDGTAIDSIVDLGGTTRFGYALDLDQGVLAVGDWANNVRHFGVLFSVATEINSLSHPDAEGNETANSTAPIATSQGTTVSGARLEDQQGTDAGALYVFDAELPDLPNKIVDLSVDDDPGDLFGHSIAIDGDVLVISAIEEAGYGANVGTIGNGGRGEIHIFDRNGDDWDYSRTIDGPDLGVGGNINDAFGRSVDISGDWIIVGANRTNDPGDGTGRVHFVDTANGDAIQTVAPPTPPDPNVNFGIRVAIDGTTAVVGATTWGATDGGRIFIYELVAGTWTLEQQYFGGGGFRFGSGIDIEGDRVAAGTIVNGGTGFVVIIDRVADVWPTQTVAFNTTDPQPNFEMLYNGVVGSQYGLDVDLDGDRVLIAAPGGTNPFAELRTFDGTDWNISQTLTPTPSADVLLADNFAQSVALDGRVAVAGGQRFITNDGVDVGGVMVFNEVGGTFVQVDEILATDGVALDQFGFEVALDGDELLVGAPGDDNSNGTDAGSVYRFAVTQPGRDDLIFSPTPAAGDFFGQSVDIHDDLMVVGARNAGEVAPLSGAAYIFRRDLATDEWQFEATLSASDGVSDQWFGQSVAIAGTAEEPDGDPGNYLVAVGAPDPFGTPGAVYLYRYDLVAADWVEVEKIDAPAGTDDFGIAVDVRQVTSAFRNGTYIVAVGAPAVFGGGNGSAHLYRYTITENPVFSETLTSLGTADSPAPAAGARHGFSIALDGNSLIVGESNVGLGGVAGIGQAHVYRYDTNAGGATLEATLTQPAADQDANDGMGSSVSLDGDIAVVGAFTDSTASVNAGAAYAFERSGTTWSAGQSLVTTTGVGDQFGFRATVEDGLIAVSSFAGGADDTGTVHTFIDDPVDGWVDAVIYEWGEGTANGTGMGSGLALSEDGVLAAGAAEYDGSAGTDSGAVQTFDVVVAPELGNKLLATGTDNDFDDIGISVSIDQPWAFVGSEDGRAYMFRNDGGSWSLFQDFTSIGGRTDVAVAPSWAAVATSGTNAATEVYEFNGAAWVPAFTTPSPAALANLTVDIDAINSFMIIGEEDDNEVGSVTIIDLNLGVGGGQPVTLNGPTTNIGFGVDVAIDGNVAFIGTTTSQEVVVLTEVGGSWVETQRITTPGTPGQQFGRALDADAGRLIVGQPGGAEAWIFEDDGGGFTDVARLNAGTASSGVDVAISGDLAVLGTPRGIVDSITSGTATVFGRAGTDWLLTDTVEPADPEFGDGFGQQVAIDGETIVVGAPVDTNQSGVAAGAAYIFEVVAPDSPSITFDLQLTGPSTVDVAPSGLAASDFDASVVESTTSNETSIGSTPLSAIELSDTPLSAITVGATPLSAIILDSAPLSAIPLINIDVDDGWEALLADTDLANVPLVDLTFGTALNDPVVAARFAEKTLASINVRGTPLSAIPLSAIALGPTPLSAIPLSAIDASLDWCAIIQPYFPAGTCTTEADLTDVTLMEATLAGTPLSAIPLSAIPLSAIPLSAIPLSAIPLSAINFQATPLSAIPLSAIPLSAIGLDASPLSAIPLSAIPLSAIPLSAIPLSAIDVAGSPLSAIPLSAIGVDGAPLSAIPVSVPLNTTPLSAIGVESTPLSAIPLSAILLADTPLSAIPLSAIGGGATDWCTVLASEDHGVTCDNGVDPTATTLGELFVRGVPLSAIPLSAIPLSAIPLSAIPLSAIPLSAIPLSAISLEALPLSAIDLQGTPLSAIDPTATPLSAIPLSAIPLSAIDVVGSPLSAIPLSAIPLSAIGLDSTPLSAIPLSAIPLSAIPLSAIDLAGSPLSAIPLSAIDLIGSPLSAIPLSAIPLSAITVDCSLVSCVSGSLGDAVSAGAVDLTATLDDLQPALSSYRLADLVEALAATDNDGMTEALSDAALLLSDLSGYDDVAFGELPLSLLGADDITLGDLSGALFDVSLNDLVGALIDPSTGAPFSDTDTQDALDAAVDAAAGALELSDAEALGDVTLGDLLDGGPTVTVGDLGAILGFVSIQSILDYLGVAPPTLTGSLGDLDPEELGNLVLGSLFGNAITSFDTLLVGELLQDLDDQGLLEGFTLGDLLLALVGAGDLSFGGFSFADVEVSSLPAGTVPAVGMEATFVVDSSLQRTVEVEVTLPSTASYVEGAELTITSGGFPAVVVPSEPTIAGNRLTWTVTDVTPGDSYAFTFDVLPTVSLGVTSIGGSARVLGTEVDAGADASVQVAEGLESNDTPATATPVTPDTIYLTYIPDATDIDVFSVAVQDNDILAIELSNLGADLDVALYYEPPPGIAAGALAGTNGEDATIPITDPDQTGADAEIVDDFVRLDQIDPDLSLLEVSNARSTENELIVTDLLQGGTYYVQVFGANGASSVQPAALQVQLNEAENRPECVALGALPAAPAGTTNTIDASTNAVFLVNEQRLEQLHSVGERAQVMTELNELVTYLDNNPDFGVDAAIVAVESVPSVQAAYTAWDNPANPEDACDPDRANTIVAEINAEILNPVRDQLDFVVIIGGDEQIPMARLLDETSVANEYDYRHEFDGDLTGANPDGANAFTSVFWERRYLSDEPYGESGAQDLGNRYLYVSDLALGRLVESPTQIVQALDDFATYQGSLDISTASVLGYDFLADGSEKIADNLEANITPVDSELADGFDINGVAWDRAAAETAVGAAGENALISLNAHFDHYRALPAAGDQVPGFTDNLIAADALGGVSLAQTVVFSMGCHGGLAVPDNLIGTNDDDWAETIAGAGGIFIANTGFGYGDTETVAYSEELMALFSEHVASPVEVGGVPITVGEAMMFAKNQYIADLAVLSVYDEKALMESTFYGLPFYRTALPSTPEPPVPVNEPNPDPLGSPVLSLTIDPVNQQVTTPSGNYWSNPDGDGGEYTIVSPGRPIQPADTADISVVDVAGDTTVLDQTARGAIVTDMTSTWLLEPNPVVATPIFDESNGQPEPELGDQTFPTKPVSVNTYLTPSGERQSLVVATGQYRSSTEAQRLDADIDLTVYYAAPTDTDYTEPTITNVNSTVEDGLLTVTLTAEDDDPAGVERVYVLLAEEPGFGVVDWRGLDLSGSGNGQWAGSIELDVATEDVEFLVQAKDPTGNVGFATNKANNFNDDTTPPEPPPPTPDLDVEEDPANLDAATGWYTGTATVNVESGDDDATYSVDGGPAQPVLAAGSFDIVGDGIHTWEVTTSSGQSQNGTVRIDTTGPPQVIVGTPVDGGSYEVGTASFDLLCTDPSLENCTISVDGAAPVDYESNIPLPPVGSHTVVITATDVFGNTTTESIAFEVTAPVTAVPDVVLVDGPTTPQLISDGVLLDIEFDDADGVVDDYTVTIDWGDADEDDPASTSTVCTAASGAPQAGNPSCEILTEPSAGAVGVAAADFVYAEAGVYAITVTVEDAAGNTDTEIFEFVVVYDPGGGNVSGAGWFWSGDEAYDDPDPWGEWAFFGYRARYQNGDATPTGRTRLHLWGEFFFKSTAYDYLIVNDSVAVAEGVGKLNGQTGYRFRVQGVDNGWLDFFQITIWEEATGDVIYDNGVLYDEGDAVLFGGIRVRE